MHEIAPSEIKKMIEENANIQIIDIRDDYVFEDFNLGGTNIPLENVINNKAQFENDKKTVFICNSGKRSSAIVRTLTVKHQLPNIYSLKGGIEAYVEECL